MSPTSRGALRFAVALPFLAFLLTPQTEAQQPARTIERLMREQQSRLYKRAVEDGLRKPPKREEEERLALAQITEDYERIQHLNHDLAQAASDPADLDLKFAAESTSEIRRRAERLLENLALPEVPAGMERVRMPTEGEEHLRSSLGMLRRLVERFVRSPLFREVNVVDAQVSARARRDLEGIIELSGRLKKDCDRFNRGAR